MLDMVEILDTIKELENGSTTFDNCSKLASLYIIKDKFIKDKVEEELNDILPTYRRYVTVKRNYQLQETTKENVLLHLKSVCDELSEFLLTLYRCTDFEQERTLIRNLFKEVERAL